jgi:hypothetical protein
MGGAGAYVNRSELKLATAAFQHAPYRALVSTALRALSAFQLEARKTWLTSRLAEPGGVLTSGGEAEACGNAEVL